jgi:hypothetical protein
MKKKILIFIGVLVFLMIIGSFAHKNSDGVTNTPANSQDSVQTDTTIVKQTAQLPENNFDTNVAIPGTKLTLSYPAKGFYEKGAVVKTFTPRDPAQYGNVLTIQTEKKFDKEIAAQFPTLIVSLEDAAANDTLKSIMAGLDSTSIEADAIKANGHYQTINGHEFFLFKVDYDLMFWKGITMVNNQIISLTLMYNPEGGAQSKAAVEHNDAVFLEILQHITYR